MNSKLDSLRTFVVSERRGIAINLALVQQIDFSDGSVSFTFADGTFATFFGDDAATIRQLLRTYSLFVPCETKNTAH